ncbi:MAG: sensor histidine kinase [Spirochaetales bacterium]|nr:sensor histidine kinase [Spirochaetales bacterium]
MFEGDPILYNVISLLAVIEIYLVYLRIGTGKLITGTGYWIAGIGAYIVALAVISFQDHFPAAFMLIVINSGLNSCTGFLYLGLRSFNGVLIRRNIIFSVIVYLSSVLLLFLFTIVYSSIFGRTAIFTISSVLFIMLSLKTITTNSENHNLPGKLTVFFMCVFILFSLLKLFSIPFLPDPNIYNPNDIITVISLIGLAISTGGLSLGLALLIVWRLKDRADKLAADREMLIRETHHRIKNNLAMVQSLLSLEAGKHKENSPTRESLQECRNRISSIFNVHEMLHRQENLNRNRLDLYLNKVAEDVFNSYNLETVQLHFTSSPIETDIAQLVPCGLIINELISNACKHAFPDNKSGQISVNLSSSQSAESDNQIIHISIKDNGIGFGSTSNSEEQEGFGLNMVRQLVEQMDGELEIQNHKGTNYYITIRG